MRVQDWLGEDNKLSLDIFENKYRRNGESFDEWLDRVSGKDEAVKELILQKKFLFGGRILANRGTHDKFGTYSNCYVTTVEDSIESIYETCKKLARTYSYGGGVGLDISKLAPEGAKVNNQAGTTSGAVSFMGTFSNVADTISQGSRRAALMISIDCKHPDLEKFISIKNDLSKVTSANISVRVSDEFMKAVEDDLDWELSFTREETGETISKTVKAKEIFKLLCKNNWDFAEPGILFWDRIEGYNLLSNNLDFHYSGVNPCAEEPLPAGGSCLLGAINLAEFVESDGSFKWHDLDYTTRIAIRAMNDVLEEGLHRHPLEEQRQTVSDWKQIGLGIMGLSEMLIKMELRYGSKESLDICDRIGHQIAHTALQESSLLAMEKGKYPKYNNLVLDSTFFKAHADKQLLEQVRCHGLRNSQLLTIAPTGTISTLLNVGGGGAEPIFANSYNRLTKSLHGEDVRYKVYTPIVEKYMKEHGIVDEADLPEWFVTSKDIPVEERIAMQAVWQKHIDASISSTVNLPNEATVEDVENLYMEAWKQGLKGITIYRAGCAREGILTEEPKKKEEEIPTMPVPPRSNIGLERHLMTGCGSLHVCAYFDEYGDLKNTYLSKGSTGGCNSFMVGLSRMISLAARNGADVYQIVDQLNSTIPCPSYAVRTATKKDTSKGNCCPAAVGNALIDMYEQINRIGKYKDDNYVSEFSYKPKEIAENAKVNKERTSTLSEGSTCPECGEPLLHIGGCIQCSSCHWSRCE